MQRDGQARTSPSGALALQVGQPSVGGGIEPMVHMQRGDLKPGATVRIVQGEAEAILPAALDPTLAPNAVRVPAGREQTKTLGPMFGPISVAKA